MSILDELEAEVVERPLSKRSQIDIFLDTLEAGDRADVMAWIEAGKSIAVLFRVLERRGLPVADSTFRNWAAQKCR